VDAVSVATVSIAFSHHASILIWIKLGQRGHQRGCKICEDSCNNIFPDNANELQASKRSGQGRKGKQKLEE
jgi:hypothetical protein